jgi:AbrB family looped-hinge helix DNA binding protein
MSNAGRLTTKVSTKGQVILPKSIRQERRWSPGTRLIVEDTPDGVLLKAAPCLRHPTGRRVWLPALEEAPKVPRRDAGQHRG